MEGTVTISIKDFERLRRCEEAVDKAYKALSKCEYADDTCQTVDSEPVLEAIEAIASV